jgi:hypothetical protein
LTFKQVVQIRSAFGQQLAALHEVAFADADVLALGNQVDAGFSDFRLDDKLALALGIRAKAHDAVDFGQNGLILGLAHLEQFGDSRQTADNVLGLHGFARLAGDDVARLDHIAVVDHDDGPHGQVRRTSGYPCPAWSCRPRSRHRWKCRGGSLTSGTR